MPLLIGSRVEHHGQILIVGHGGRLYAPRTSTDAWGRTRPTQKVTKYRIVTCACGHSFIAHDGRMKTCEACQAHAQQLRRTRRTAEAQRFPTPCIQCGQRVVAQRSTRRYCSRACQQQAYRERRSLMTEVTQDQHGSG
ncbi:MAG TPA: hypothetical protein P5186_29200 [Candidatus Paceibacterota bacterium]|nr:hypothetical protein [Candidatus Paceibacterota bacterium]